MTGVEKLLEKESGSATAVAAKLTDSERECTRQLVEYWAKRGYVTPAWVPYVNRVYGIPYHELNPIYPKSYPKSAA
jgi:hypothetical protein